MRYTATPRKRTRQSDESPECLSCNLLYTTFPLSCHHRESDQNRGSTTTPLSNDDQITIGSKQLPLHLDGDGTFGELIRNFEEPFCLSELSNRASLRSPNCVQKIRPRFDQNNPVAETVPRDRKHERNHSHSRDMRSGL